jgi:hypothetical protein
MTVEEKTALALSGASCELTLGGRSYTFRPLSLCDREQISVLASVLSTSVREDMTDGELLKEAVACGRYGKVIALIISAGAHVRGFAPLAAFRRWRLYRAAYRSASTPEIMACVKHILEGIEPAFFLGIIISLSRQNMLKPTKETEATAPG